MMQLSNTEENYLKSIYHLGDKNNSNETSTNAIADWMMIKPATVTSMLKKLREKEIINYEKYGKVSLTQQGKDLALQIVRKHRLWEVFLVEKMNFTWDEVHEIAEQLEHIQSVKLINELDAFLKFPEFDPHGDPIPNVNGEIKHISKTTLAQAQIGKEYDVVAVNDSSSEFLQYLMQLKITLSTKIKIINRFEFDKSNLILVDGKHKITVSEKFSEKLIIS
jgi:DtxR family Mn-dependent transcriptional regulator